MPDAPVCRWLCEPFWNPCVLTWFILGSLGKYMYFTQIAIYTREIRSMIYWQNYRAGFSRRIAMCPIHSLILEMRVCTPYKGQISSGGSESEAVNRYFLGLRHSILSHLTGLAAMIALGPGAAPVATPWSVPHRLSLDSKYFVPSELYISLRMYLFWVV